MMIEKWQRLCREEYKGTNAKINWFRKNAGLPESPIFEIFGSGSSSRQIKAPAPTHTPPLCPRSPTHTQKI